MHCVYFITFTERLKYGIKPYYYIGSKSNYLFTEGVLYDKRGKPYYGSSSYNEYELIVAENTCTVDILYEDLDYHNILAKELEYQINFDCVASTEFFNLSYATKNNFSDPNYATYKHITAIKTVRLRRDHPLVLSGEYVGVSKNTILSPEVKRKIGRSGELNAFYGKQHSDKTKAIIGAKNAQRVKTPEEIENWRQKVAKRPMTEAHKEIMRKFMSDKMVLKNVDTGECIQINRNDKSNYNPEVWKNPAAISQKRESCVHCGKTSTAGNIKRWHNDNCKEKI